MIGEFIALLTKAVGGTASNAELETLKAQFLRMMTVSKNESVVPYAPAQVGTDVDKLDGHDGSFYQNADNITAGTMNTDRFSAYNDLVAESKIGTGATQVAAGNHSNHNVENLANVAESNQAAGDVLQRADWTEIPGGTESLYDSALLIVDGLQETGGNVIENAYDKNMTNQWVSFTGPHWTTAAFSRKRFVSKVVLTHNAGDFNNVDAPKTITIYGSHTGAFGGEETQIFTLTQGAFSGITTCTIATPRSAYRYYKITFPTNTNLRLNEIQFYTMPDEQKWENKTLAVIAAGIKIDDLGAPDDNTDLNASTAKHGLMQKYPGGTTNFLRSDGMFAVPTSTDAAAIHGNVSGEIIAIAEKTTPADTDVALIEDSAATNAKKRLSWANIKATLKTYMDTLYAVIGHTHAPSAGADTTAIHDNVSNEIALLTPKPAIVLSDYFLIEDTEAANAKKKVTFQNIAQEVSDLYKGAIGGFASLNISSLVVQNPANATATPTASKIPIADGYGRVDDWMAAIVGKAYRSTAQDIPDTTWTSLSFSALEIDSKPGGLTAHWVVGTPTRVFCRWTGIYYIQASCLWAADGTGIRFIRLLKNGAEIIRSTENNLTATWLPMSNAATILSLAAGDYIEAQVYQSSGASLQVVVSFQPVPQLMIAKI